MQTQGNTKIDKKVETTHYQPICSHIRCQGFSLTDAIQLAVGDAVQRRLQRFDNDITSVRVFLRRNTEQRGTQCFTAAYNVHLRYGRTENVEAQHADLYQAIQDGARRARRATKRALTKQREYRRREGLRSLAWRNKLVGDNV